MDALTLADFEGLARERMEAGAWAYLQGGAGSEHTLAANLDDWARWRLLPRALRPLPGLSTATRWGTRALAHPIGLAPVAYQRLAHPDGERATALAAAAQGAPMVLSAQSSVALEEVAQAFAGERGGAPWWLQLYWQPEQAALQALIERAEAAGCEALVLTVDAPVHAVRDRELRSRFRLPPGVSAVNLAAPLAQGELTELLAAAPDWDSLNALRRLTRLPIWLKGVLHPDDAQQACDWGAQGLIVSNHGGRTLDGAVSTAWALPGVVAAVDGRVPVLVDGGIRRGTDVLKALALGADGVLIGRPQVHALAAQGALGVARLIRLLRDELAIAMALCGCRRIDELHPGLLVR